MFDRLIALIGKQNVDKLSELKILILGLGGVGGYVLEALVRSGIRNLTIVDGDSVDITNLNRQIIALHSTIGRKKVEVMKERLMDISPDAKIETIDKFLKPDDIVSLNLEEYDYVVDAIDDVKVKIELAKYACEHSIKLIMSTGTARKLDPSRLYMTTLNKTSYDPLAKRVRKALDGYDQKKIICLCSDEIPNKIDDKTLGSSAFVPSSAGLLIASYIVNDVIKKEE